MQLSILAFGQVAGVTGTNINIAPVKDTDELLVVLKEQYPPLQNLQFAVAVDKKLVQQNKPLRGDETIALLPPFSGG